MLKELCDSVEFVTYVTYYENYLRALWQLIDMFYVNVTYAQKLINIVKKIIMKEQRIYCKSPKTLNGVQSIIEKIIPAKIPIPPNEGVLVEWDRLSPGSSIKCLTFAILMIDGIET